MLDHPVIGASAASLIAYTEDMVTQYVSFTIQGMYCASCAINVEQRLRDLEGVLAAHVNYASERANVTYDAERANTAQWVGAIRALGFEVPTERARVPLWRLGRLAAFDARGVVSVRMNWSSTALEIEQMVVLTSNRGQPLSVRTLPSLLLGSRLDRRRAIPPLAGIGAGLALLGLYLGIISAAQSPGHALDEWAQDRLWVGLVALGFGTQVGLYVYLRLLTHALRLAGAGAMTGAGTGTSTLGMIACCAHHVTDFAPLVMLMGASGLSGAVSALTEWKYLFISVGLVVNAIGIVVTLRFARSAQAHGRVLAIEPAPACR